VHIRTNVAAVKGVEDEILLKILGAFPGVLSFWLSDAHRQQMKDVKDLVRVAVDAQRYRYREFDVLFPQLSATERTLAIRLAFFPRLNLNSWLLFRDVLLDGIDEASLDGLNIKKVIEGGVFPVTTDDHRAIVLTFQLLKEFIE
jgi:hypothetical protein